MNKKEKIFEIEESMPEYNLKIIQNNKYFKYGVDSIALAKFAASHNTQSTVVDMCSGTGIVGLVYSRLIEEKVSKNKGYRDIQRLIFVEKQKYFADLNTRNLELNNFENFEVINKDIKNPSLLEQITANSADIILINPPYNISTSSILSDLEEKANAKFEESDFLSVFFDLANKILRDRGKIYMVNKPERLVDIFIESRKNNIEPKKLKSILSNPYKRPSLVLIEFVKNAKPFLKIEDPFIINYD